MPFFRTNLEVVDRPDLFPTNEFAIQVAFKEPVKDKRIAIQAALIREAYVMHAINHETQFDKRTSTNTIVVHFEDVETAFIAAQKLGLTPKAQFQKRNVAITNLRDKFNEWLQAQTQNP